jgi:hypothetical protein
MKHNKRKECSCLQIYFPLFNVCLWKPQNSSKYRRSLAQESNKDLMKTKRDTQSLKSDVRTKAYIQS